MDNNECIVTFLSVEGLKSLCGLFLEGIVVLRGHFHSYPQSLQVPQDHNLLKYKDDVLRPCLPSNLFSVNSSDLAEASELQKSFMAASNISYSPRRMFHGFQG